MGIQRCDAVDFLQKKILQDKFKIKLISDNKNCVFFLIRWEFRGDCDAANFLAKNISDKFNMKLVSDCSN